jgi:hypothetical protein
MTEKSSGDKCTQRAGIRVTEELTYAPSIWKMISTPREFTAKPRRDDENRPSEVNTGEEKSKGQ